MKQEDIEKVLKRKVELKGKRLGEVLTEPEQALISFWTVVENKVHIRKDIELKEAGLPMLTDIDEIRPEIEAEGNKILAEFGGDAQQALGSLI